MKRTEAAAYALAAMLALSAVQPIHTDDAKGRFVEGRD